MRLKKHYSSREVAVLTGLSARQLQWWDARRLFVPAIRSHRTEAGGFTERRYTPMDVLELQVLADLRRRGFSIPQLRRLLSTLREVFGIRLVEATILPSGLMSTEGTAAACLRKANGCWRQRRLR